VAVCLAVLDLQCRCVWGKPWTCPWSHVCCAWWICCQQQSVGLFEKQYPFIFLVFTCLNSSSSSARLGCSHNTILTIPVSLGDSLLSYHACLHFTCIYMSSFLYIYDLLSITASSMAACLVIVINQKAPVTAGRYNDVLRVP